MKLKLAVLAALGCLVLAGSAEAIEGPRAVRHIKLAVKEDCHSYPDFSCEGWRVYHCYKLGRRKVRCRAWQEYRHNGNLRTCYFTAAAVERRHSPWVDLHFGRTRCYSESGALIPSR